MIKVWYTICYIKYASNIYLSLTSEASLTFKYLLCTYKMSDTVLETGARAIIKTDTVSF